MTVETSIIKNGFFIKVNEAHFLCRLISNKLSQRIIQLLYQHQSLTVTEIFTQLRLMQSVTSQYLARLRGAGIVKARRDGKQIYYELNHEKMAQVQYFIDTLLKVSR